MHVVLRILSSMYLKIHNIQSWRFSGSLLTKPISEEVLWTSTFVFKHPLITDFEENGHLSEYCEYRCTMIVEPYHCVWVSVMCQVRSGAAVAAR